MEKIHAYMYTLYSFYDFLCIAIMMSLTLMLAKTACGSKEDPADVQADIEVEEHMEQYQTVYAEVSKIESKAADSPLVLK